MEPAAHGYSASQKRGVREGVALTTNEGSHRFRGRTADSHEPGNPTRFPCLKCTERTES
jgi:hypothetical protein